MTISALMAAEPNHQGRRRVVAHPSSNLQYLYSYSHHPPAPSMDITMESTTLLESRCEKLDNPDYKNLLLSMLILLGILFSYLPQHYRIISRKSSEGISPYFILLGAVSSTCAFANILVLPASRADVACCKTVSPFSCFTGLLGIAQVGLQWSCFAGILFLFLVFFPRDQALPSNTGVPQYTWRSAVTVAFISLAHGFLTIIFSAWLVISKPDYLLVWANVLGITAAILAAIQYFPQIWTTYRLQHVGSLSIPMMLIQTPGSFVWAGSLAARLGIEGWSTWGVYLITGSLQGCLLALGIYFEYQARKAGINLGSEIPPRTPPAVDTTIVEADERVTFGNGRQSERTPLLEGQPKGP